MTEPRPPKPLPPHVRAMLATYREAHELPSAARERIWSVVGAEAAPAPAFDPEDDEAIVARATGGRRRDARSGPAPLETAGNARWLGWAVASLAVAAALVLAWQLGGSLAARRQAARSPDAAVMQGDAHDPQGRASHPAPSRATPRDAAPSLAVPPAPEPPASAPSAPPREDLTPSRTTNSSRTVPSNPNGPAPRSPRPATDAPARDVSATAPASTLAAERELVARAWRALALGELAQALVLAAEHARRFPAGLLAPERAAVDTIARCRRGDADGLARASAFHRAHPRSPLAGRIDEACAAAPSKSSPTP